MASWSLIREYPTPPNTIRSTDISQMYCMSPDVVPFDLNKYYYEVGTKLKIPAFYISMQNFCHFNALRVVVKTPPFVRVFSKGSNVELTKFFLVPKNAKFEIEERLPTNPKSPPIFGYTGTDMHGLLVMKVIFDDSKAILDPEFVLGPQSDGKYTLDFEIKPFNVTTSVYVFDNIPCPSDINKMPEDEKEDVQDDGTIEEPPVEEEEDRVTITIDEGDAIGDILWIDGTTGITYNADSKNTPQYPYRELPDDWIAFGGMMFPPDEFELTPCIIELLTKVNRNDVPPIGYKRRGYQLNPWAFLNNVTSEKNQNDLVRSITAKTWKCLIADIGEQINDFEIPKRGVPKTFRYGLDNSEYSAKMEKWVIALVKLIRLRQFFADGNSFPEEQKAGPINKAYGEIVKAHMPVLGTIPIRTGVRDLPLWGAFGVGENIIDWGDHIEMDTTEELVKAIRKAVDRDVITNDKYVFAWAFKQLVELFELGKEIPTGNAMNRQAAPFSTTVASIIYDIQEKGEGKIPPIPGPYNKDKKDK